MFLLTTPLQTQINDSRLQASQEQRKHVLRVLDRSWDATGMRTVLAVRNVGESTISPGRALLVGIQPLHSCHQYQHQAGRQSLERKLDAKVAWKDMVSHSSWTLHFCQASSFSAVFANKSNWSHIELMSSWWGLKCPRLQLSLYECVTDICL